MSWPEVALVPLLRRSLSSGCCNDFLDYLFDFNHDRHSSRGRCRAWRRFGHHLNNSSSDDFLDWYFFDYDPLDWHLLDNNPFDRDFPSDDLLNVGRRWRGSGHRRGRRRRSGRRFRLEFVLRSLRGQENGRGRHGHGAAGSHHREPVLLQGPEDLPAHLRDWMPRGLQVHAAFQRFPEVLRSPEVLRFGFKVFAQRAFHVFVRRVVTGHGRKPLWRRPLQVGPGADRGLGLAWI